MRFVFLAAVGLVVLVATGAAAGPLGSILTPSGMDRGAERGEPLFAVFTVTNQWPRATTFLFNQSSWPATWTVDLPQPVKLEVGGSAAVLVIVRAADAPQDGTLLLVASEENGLGSVDSSTLNVTWNEADAALASRAASTGASKAVDRSTPAPDRGQLVALVASILTGAIGTTSLLCLPSVRARLGLLWLLSRHAHGHGGLLEQETRRRVEHAVREQPGIHFSALRRHLDVGTGCLAYHLHLLERAGAVNSIHDGFRRRYFIGPARSGFLPATATEAALLGAVTSQPGIEQREVAKRLGLNKHTISYYVLRLVRQGAIETFRAGRTRRLFLRATKT